MLQYTVNVPTTRLLGPSNFALSADGSTLAYAAGALAADPGDYGALHVRRLDALSPTRVATLGTVIRALSWSPDGRALLSYGADLRVTDVDSGLATEIGGASGSLVCGSLVYGVAWGTGRTSDQWTWLPGVHHPSPAASDAPVTGDGGRVFPSFLADGQRPLAGWRGDPA